jgi:hypothetical protein
MLGQKNITFCNAKQAKQVHQYKNIKTKLYKNNVAVWYNKTCRLKQLSPSYINIKVSGTNPQSQKTKNVAIPYKINEELKFLYAKNSMSSYTTYTSNVQLSGQAPGNSSKQRLTENYSNRWKRTTIISTKN